MDTIEATNTLANLKRYISGGVVDSKASEAINMAIRALEVIVDTDTVSRQAVLDAIMGEPTDAHYPSWYAERIKALPPSPTSSKPHGKWIGCGDYPRVCSVCGDEWDRYVSGTIWYEDVPDFCPSCGAYNICGDYEIIDDDE